MCLSEYECIVCCQYMHPPIRHCTQGHSYCNSCSTKMQSCPVCRSQHNPRTVKNLMDQFHQHILFPCQCNDTECNCLVLESTSSSISMLCRNCQPDWILCPFSSFAFCTWIGRTSLAEEHLYEEHHHNLYRGPKVLCEWSRTDEYCRRANFVIVAYNELFHCILKYDMFMEQLQISVYCLRDLEEAGQYRFKVSVDFGNNRQVITTELCGTATDYKNNMGKQNMYSFLMQNAKREIGLTFELEIIECNSCII